MFYQLRTITAIMLDGNSYGMYMLDQELAARVYATPSPLAAKA